jgi:Protein of unknown function (DUF1559)
MASFPAFSWIAFVILVVLLVAGLIVPAIMKTRHAANSAKSQYNLRKIALGIDSYHDGNIERFPMICDFGPSSPTESGLRSLHFLILPFVEGGSVLWGYESTSDYFRPENPPAGWTISTYLSPFETTSKTEVATHRANIEGPEARPRFERKFGGDYSTTNYVANGMVFSIQADGEARGRKTVVDGLSTTIMIAERKQVCDGPEGTVPTLWALGAFSAATASFALAAPEGEHPRTTEPQLVLRQFVPPAKGGVQDNSVIAFQVSPKPGECDARFMQGLNARGMTVCMFDGSTRVIQSSISPATFWATVTPAGNESLGADW